MGRERREGWMGQGRRSNGRVERGLEKEEEVLGKIRKRVRTGKMKGGEKEGKLNTGVQLERWGGGGLRTWKSVRGRCLIEGKS